MINDEIKPSGKKKSEISQCYRIERKQEILMMPVLSFLTSVNILLVYLGEMDYEY